MIPHNIYIHVPFCISKCNYCAFFSHARAAPNWENYKNQILGEINYWSEKLSTPPTANAEPPLKGGANTIFFGGGTPSLMSTKIFAEIMTALRRAFDVASNAEITIEANPGTLDATRLAEFIAAGVNRLSIGVQSLRDDELKFLGRLHTADNARKLIAAAQNMGVRVSADFIYGLPGQTPDDVRNLCRQINKLNLEHVSLYELSIEPGTKFATQNLQMPDNETMAQMYEVIGDTLNLGRYEVSNYGTPCQHNANVWDGEPYLGLGNGAAGRILVNSIWFETMNAKEILLDPLARATEILMTGLRTTRGVNLTPEIRAIINWDNVNDEEFEIKDNRIRAKTFLTLDSLLVKLLK
jgi:oxygen-independent coproporphyrinogen-3 oxidase